MSGSVTDSTRMKLSITRISRFIRESSEAISHYPVYGKYADGIQETQSPLPYNFARRDSNRDFMISTSDILRILPTSPSQ